MKNYIKLTVVILFVCSPFFAISQETVEKKDIDKRIDNWRYWQEKAEQGIVPINPELPPQPIIDYRLNKAIPPVDPTDILIVSGAGISQSENSVFINPNDNQIVLNGNNAFLGAISPVGANAMFTFDGGLTWTGGPSAPITDNMGDPAMAIGLNGISYAGHTEAGLAQGINISPDDGLTWSSTLVASGGYLDKDHLWIDNSPSSIYEGNLYCAWTQFIGSPPGEDEINIARSTDNGLTWSAPQTISLGVAASNVCHGVNIQTGPAGEVYVTWAIYDGPVDSGEDAIGFCKSTDGGLTFSTAVRIHGNIQGVRGTPLTNPTGKNHRTNSFPVMACDISGGINNGDLYITWSNVGVPGINVGPDVSVYMMRSTDDGATWATPTRINQDPIGNVQYFPWITSDPETGDLHTIFYDDRNVGGTMVETWVASSTDGGVSWTELRISDVAFTPAPIPGMAGGYMGDYLGIAARRGQVYPVWTDNRTGQTLSYTSPFTFGCHDDVIITTDVIFGATDHQEARFTITASNDIAYAGEAIYNAGDEILMTDGFSSILGSAYRAYIEACTGTFILAPETSGEEEDDPEYVKAPKPKLVDYYDENKSAIELTVYPNPTSDIFNVQLNEGALLNNFDVRIYSMSQGLVSVNQFDNRNANTFQIDISDFASGVYFIEVIDTENDKVYSSKVIKK